MTRRLNAKKAVFYFENSLFVLLVYFSEFHFCPYKLYYGR